MYVRKDKQALSEKWNINVDIIEIVIYILLSWSHFIYNGNMKYDAKQYLKSESQALRPKIYILCV